MRLPPNIILVSLFLLSGCGTIETKKAGAWGQKYSGTRCDFQTMQHVGKKIPVLGHILLSPWVILSATADTFLLPFDLASSTKPVYSGCWFEDANQARFRG